MLLFLRERQCLQLNCHYLDDLRLEGLVVVVCSCLCDLVYDLDTLCNLTESGIRTVEVRCILVHDEELRSCGIGIHSTCHGDNASGVLKVVSNAVRSELTLDVISGTAHTRSVGASALDHEAGDNTVECKSVIEALACELDEVLYCDGSDLGIELNLDVAQVLDRDSYDGICH